MDKGEIKRKLVSCTNSSKAQVITKSQIRGFLGWKPRSNVDRFTDGLECIDNKYYFIDDIAIRIQNLIQIK